MKKRLKELKKRVKALEEAVYTAKETISVPVEINPIEFEVVCDEEPEEPTKESCRDMVSRLLGN